MSKHFLIAGGSSGIGLQLTKDLLSEGNEVTVLSRTRESLPSEANHHTFDVSDQSAVVPDFGSLDRFAYLPGTINLKPFHRLKREDFLKDFEINVLGGIKILQAILPALKKSNSAAVVFFSTVAVRQGMGFHSSIAAGKGALEGLTRSLAAELAPAIRVNCIAPSVTDTPLASRLLSSDDKKEASGKRHALNRIGTCEDIANTAAFLLSEKAAWITGQVIGVDGGMSTLRQI